jgi:hypothetical protein
MRGIVHIVHDDREVFRNTTVNLSYSLFVRLEADAKGCWCNIVTKPPVRGGFVTLYA